MRKIVLLASFVLILVACNKENRETNTGGFRLNVTVKNSPDSTRVYLYDEDLEIKLDSAYVVNDSFTFSGKANLPSLHYLFFFDSQNIRSEHYKYLFIENKDISIDGEYSDFFNARVTGSVETDLMAKYHSISANSEKSKKTSNQLDFLYSNANYQMTLNELLYKKKEISTDSLFLFYEKLDSINADSPKGQELLAYSQTVQLRIGDRFRDISGNDHNGVEHKLSDYLGKIILLNFWSPDCGYSRQQQEKELPKLVQKYNQEDFVIISYCVDSDRKEWEKLSKKGYANWLNISDLEGMKGPNISEYDVTGIPDNFLIDKNGIVVTSLFGFYEGENRIEKEIDKLLK